MAELRKAQQRSENERIAIADFDKSVVSRLDFQSRQGTAVTDHRARPITE
jgi:hypothetical protein